MATVRDSAGVRILALDLVRPIADAAPAVKSTPRIAVGSVDGDEPYLLSHVAGACVVPGGDLMIANAESQEVRLFDSAGSYIKHYGRSGGGPDEFAALSGLWCAGDKTRFAYDWTTRRVTLLSPDASPLRRVVLGEHAGASATDVIGMLPDGRILTKSTSAAPVGPIPGVQATPAILLLHDATGKLVKEIVTVPDRERFLSPTNPPGGVLISRVPFGRVTQAIVAGELLAIGTQRDRDIRLYDVDGQLRIIVRLSEPARVASSDVVARVIAGDPVFRGLNASVVGERPIPFYGQLAAAPGDRLWIQDYASDVRERVGWRIVDLVTGRVDRVRLPTGMSILEITPAVIVALAKDELDVEQVRVYDLLRHAR